MSMHPSNPPQLTGGRQRITPADVAQVFTDYMVAACKLILSGLLGATALAVGYCGVRLLLWLCGLVTHALNLTL